MICSRVWMAGMVIVAVAVISPAVLAQSAVLKGQYEHHRKNEIWSMFIFDDDGVSFMASRSGDMASIYSEGTFELKGSSLILHYDSTGVRKRVSRTHIVTPTGTDTLTLRNLSTLKFTLVDPLGYVENYRKVKDRLLKK